MFAIATPNNAGSSVCMGIVYDEVNLLASVLLQSTDTKLNAISTSKISAGYADSFIMVIDSNGKVTQARQVTFSSTTGSFAQGLAFNGLAMYNGAYIYFGQAKGYATKLQNTNSGTTPGFTAGGTATYNNVFVMNYKLFYDNAQKCLIDSVLDSNTASQSVTLVNNDQWVQLDSSNLNYQSTTANIQERNNFFAVYSSPYSGAFELLDTMYIPKPCAYKSVNLT